MGSICKKILTKAAIEDVWSAIRDIGALHTRLVPGFVTDTRVEPGARTSVTQDDRQFGASGFPA